jgi:hypothetical protein
MAEQAQFITLFGDVPLVRRKTASPFAVSMCLHGVSACVLMVVLRSVPRVVESDMRFPVQTLSLRMTGQVAYPTARAVTKPGQANGSAKTTTKSATGDTSKPADLTLTQPKKVTVQAAKVEGVSEKDTSAIAGAATSKVIEVADDAIPVVPAAITASDAVESGDSSLADVPVHSELAEQTLVQPDVTPKQVLLHPTPLPQVLLWKQETMPVRVVVPPAPHEAAAAVAKAFLSAPNHEKQLADQKVSPSLVPTPQNAIEAANTSPIMARSQKTDQAIPETTQRQQAQPTPVAVMSITPVKLVEGTVVLPMANQTAASGSPAQPRAAQPRAKVVEAKLDSKLKPGNGSGSAEALKLHAKPGNDAAVVSRATASKADRGALSAGAAVVSSAEEPGGGNGSVLASGDGGGDGKSAAGNGAAPQPGNANTDHITLPKDGQFGAVVVGDSIEDLYPETQGMWADRLAYTVYLHVGLRKNWILQYSLPAGTSHAGASRPEAPWPWDVTRPHLGADEMNADALLVRGIVNTDGHFEQLSVAFPPDFAQAQFVSEALRKWQFRPAKRDGQPVAVEVLLIMPSED